MQGSRVASFHDSRLIQTAQLPELADFQIMIQIHSDKVLADRNRRWTKLVRLRAAF